MTRNSSSVVTSWVTTSGKGVTICCSGERSALFLNSKSPMARESARLPLTRPKSTNPPAAVMRAFSPTNILVMVCQKVGKGTHTFVLWLVVERQGFRTSFDSKNRSRITSVRLQDLSLLVIEHAKGRLTTQI